MTSFKKLYRFQVYISILPHLYIVLCVHHPESCLLRPPCILTFSCSSIFKFLLNRFLNGFIFNIYFFRRGEGSEKGSERNIDAKEKDRSVGCFFYLPQPGMETTAQACALTGILTGDRSVCGMVPN